MAIMIPKKLAHRKVRKGKNAGIATLFRIAESLIA